MIDETNALAEGHDSNRLADQQGASCGSTVERVPAAPPVGWPLRAVMLLSFVALALASTWPLATKFTTELPLGYESETAVPLLNLWTGWWNATAAAHGFGGYFNAPIFAPTPSTFAFSEAQPTMLAVAPIVWLTGNTVAAYNVYLWLLLTLNGVAGYWLFRSVGHTRWSAWCGGAMVELLPFCFWQLGAMQLTAVFGICWSLGAVRKLLLNPTAKHGAMFGVAFAVTYWSCNYYGLYLSVLLWPVGLLCLGKPCLAWRWWVHVAGAIVLGALLVSPFITLQASLSREHQWERRPETIHLLSSELGDYGNVAGHSWLSQRSWGSPDRVSVWRCGAGQLRHIGAALGLVFGLILGGRRRWTLILLGVGAMALVCSLGLKLEWNGEKPYEWMMRWYPGFRQIRSPFRFAVFVQLAVVGLNVEAISRVDEFRGWLWRRWQDASARLLAGIVGLALSAGTGVLLVTEVLPYLQPTFTPPSIADNRLWLDWLIEQTPADSTVLCLPLPASSHVRDYQQEAAWMYFSTVHRRRLVNGYSGFFPESYVTLKNALIVASQNADGSWTPRLGLTEPERISKIATSAADYLVLIRQAAAGPDVIDAHPVCQYYLEYRMSDFRAGIDIYRVKKPRP